ncbi:hypothetical protein TNCT_131371 [Trichonephila clavata]|uniref:Uncharacterized protein n=1 Tax=Trichonephila clavata TaxID=2740835 RepID=A0A8X6LGY0_TRICU|nr:hypothetical protein TNCT_131371 [Trichonephila clavata]
MKASNELRCNHDAAKTDDKYTTKCSLFGCLKDTRYVQEDIFRCIDPRRLPKHPPHAALPTPEYPCFPDTDLMRQQCKGIDEKALGSHLTER